MNINCEIFYHSDVDSFIKGIKIKNIYRCHLRVVATNDFTCNIELKHWHNHPINSLKALNFKCFKKK